MMKERGRLLMWQLHIRSINYLLYMRVCVFSLMANGCPFVKSIKRDSVSPTQLKLIPAGFECHREYYS